MIFRQKQMQYFSLQSMDVQKLLKQKILAGIATTVMIYCMGIILLSVICFGIMGIQCMDDTLSNVSGI